MIQILSVMMKRMNQNPNLNQSKQDQVKIPTITSELKNLATSYNKEATKELEGLRDRANLIMELIKIVYAHTNSKPNKVIKEEPQSFEGAYNHQDKIQREKWRSAIKKKSKDMNQRGVRKKIKRKQIPLDRRCVKCKWIFKFKKNGMFQGRLVACGYSQTPGIDFSKNYSPVVHDVTFWLFMVLKIVHGFSTKIADIETAFLWGDLEGEIFMELEGAKHTDALVLKKRIYGFVQETWQYHKNAVQILRKIGFKGGDVDPCLYVYKSRKGIVFIGIYVDDNLLVGNEVTIDEVIKLLQKEGFSLKIEDNVEDYLLCTFYILK